MVNLLLYHQVNIWLLGTKKKNLRKVFFSVQFFRFIYDLRPLKNTYSLIETIKRYVI